MKTASGIRAVLIAAMSVMMIAALAVSCAVEKTSPKPRYHYEVRRDLSVYFGNADEVIEAVRDSLRERDWCITVSYSSHGDNMDDIDDIVDELMKLALSETDEPSEGDYIRCQLGGYETSYRYHKEGSRYIYTIDIEPKYYTDREQEKQVDEAAAELISSFGFTGNESEYERFSAIYRYVYDNVSYDRVHRKNAYHELRSTAYMALIMHTATCQGYAVLMYRLLREAGLDVRVITGIGSCSGNEEYHAWNIVRLDGVYYNFDITWDSNDGTDNYYLKCDADFTGHDRDPEFASEEFYEKYSMAEQDYFPAQKG